MASDPMEAFFKLHRDLRREGPGEPADVAWAAAVAGVKQTANIADVACGPGADISALRQVAPQGHVTGLDKTAHFVDQARVQFQHDPDVTLLRADMASIANTYDFIWCAGAVYFLGVTEALTRWRKSLNPHGAIAFSEVCWFGDARPARAQTLWQAEYPQMTDAAGIAAQVAAAGYETLGTRQLSATAWEAYFAPIDARIAALRPGADAALTEVLDEAAEEAACWRAHGDAYGYLLSVVRPV